MSLIRRSFITGAAGLLATPALAQFQAVPAPYVRGKENDPTTPGPLADGLVRVNLTTPEGDIILDLEARAAPITTANFLHYVDTKRMDSAEFYRSSHPPGAADFGVIQAGFPDHPEKLFKPIAHEPTSQTHLRHTHGTISMARFKPGSAAGDFFICVGDQTDLDADLTKPGDNLGFAAFGHVAAGMAVVKKIMAMPTDGVAKTPAMKGEILTHPVKITSARRVVPST
ncbi:MAG TPA: peptidylprolyl isomerase [Caulobacteraceae bacterium]|nr:peptidylprolyl isomerase [Caulobacteraceae bacterium]